MKKYDIKTRQGRALRLNNTSVFNPETLQPHSNEFRAALKAARRR